MRIYIIAGKARSGKDTVSLFIKNMLEKEDKKVCICPYAKYIKYYAKDYFGWDGSDDTKPRDLLNYLGTTLVREKLNKNDFFVDRTMEDILILSHYFDYFVISDARFVNEIEIPRKMYSSKVVVIKVVRDDSDSGLTDEQKKFKTEVALDEYDDYDFVINNTTLDKLEEDVRKILIEMGDINE